MIFSLSALHLSRLHPENPEYLYANTDYYNRALQGHRSCVNNVDASNAEAVLATTVMIAFQSFVALGTHGGDQSSPTPYELPLQWLKLSSGTRTLYSTCMPHIMARGRLAGLFEDASSIVNETIFLDPTNLESLNAYVRWDLDALTLTNEDLIAYNETFRLVASIHQAIRGQQNPRITWRRITTIPAHAPVRFIDMIEERQPRALAILGHMFALMALVEGDRWWFAGITQHQINGISSLLAPEWHPLMFAPVQNLQEYASDFTW
ncbi:MAG: hypothetical protein M1828_004028 [Chrysothrix sp. TS-e1954]|nr:MAG: hypothetical protein M1828_004028 [Chrysothrix sp. TS-e1954]